MGNELTFGRLKNTSFKKLYQKLYLEHDLTNKNKYQLLALAAIFLNQKDQNIQRLGYRIIVLYSNITKDYRPLYDVSINLGLYPISKAIEALHASDDSFISEFSSAYLENFKNEKIYLSEQQDQLLEFFDVNKEDSIAVIAPTSYGKSELIINSIKNNIDKNICVVVPTKALISQTRNRIIDADIKGISKVITHPEMLSQKDRNIKCILTQERLLRLLKANKDIVFDVLFIDEAHNLLEDDNRNNLLASAIIISSKRNSNIKIKFLTPFLENSTNLRLKYIQHDIKQFKIDEYIKTEKYFLHDFTSKVLPLIYDQFIDDFIELNRSYSNLFDLINVEKKSKNIVYFNKPKSIESFSKEYCTILEDEATDKINEACEQLKKFFHEEYNLINCIKKGFLYHHGSMPENVRSYIEHLYKTEDKIHMVVTSSTLLEGVNIPAETLFILDNKKGRGNLTPSQFRNLVGRVCRFNEIFSKENEDLKKLEPEIYLIKSKYCSSSANHIKYIRKVASISKIVKDNPKNVLIENVQIERENQGVKKEVDEFLKNFQDNIIDDKQIQTAQTEIGISCFANNIFEIDIIENENFMQDKLSDFRKDERVIDNSSDIFKAFVSIFLPYIKENDNFSNLLRFQFPKTSSFYSMFLDWRIKNATYKEMIASFLRYWEKLEENKSPTIVYVGKWGDTVRNGFRELWTDIKDKTNSERINLAIVRIKDEQDFLDNVLVKFIEVLNDLSLVEGKFYNLIKFGTDQREIISLIKNGISIGLAHIIYENYRDFFLVDVDEDFIVFDKKLANEMIKNGENHIYIMEVNNSCNIY